MSPGSCGRAEDTQVDGCIDEVGGHRPARAAKLGGGQQRRCFSQPQSHPWGKQPRKVRRHPASWHQGQPGQESLGTAQPNPPREPAPRATPGRQDTSRPAEAAPTDISLSSKNAVRKCHLLLPEMLKATHSWYAPGKPHLTSSYRHHGQEHPPPSTPPCCPRALHNKSRAPACVWGPAGDQQ